MKKYAEHNRGQVNINEIFKQLDANSIALQYQYISANPHPLGKKDALLRANDSSNYSYFHKTSHPHIRDYLEKFGFYDIFPVDPDSGDIVYSVFNELDYTTSLMNSPFANSGIGHVFKQANTSNNSSYVALADFAPYTPSYEDPAAFIASPIYAGKKSRHTNFSNAHRPYQ